MSNTDAGTGWRIYLNSQDGFGESTSQLDYRMTGNGPRDVAGTTLYANVSCCALQISWYNVNKNNNQISFMISPSTNYIVTVPEGYYSTIATLITAANAAILAAVGLATQSLSYDTLRDTVSWRNSGATDCTVLWGNGVNSTSSMMFETFGWQENLQSVLVANGDTYEGTGATFLLYTPVVYVQSSRMGLPSMDSRLGGMTSDILAIVPTSSDVRLRWIDQVAESFYVPVTENVLQNFQIGLFDSRRRLIPTRGGTYTIEITIQRRDNPDAHAEGRVTSLQGHVYEEPMPMRQLTRPVDQNRINKRRRRHV